MLFYWKDEKDTVSGTYKDPVGVVILEGTENDAMFYLFIFFGGELKGFMLFPPMHVAC